VRFLSGWSTLLVALLTLGCSEPEDEIAMREVIQPAHWRLEIPQDWEIQVAAPRWVQEQDPLNVTEFLDRQLQFAASGERQGIGVAAMYDADEPIDLARQLELQREPTPMLEFDAEGVTERTKGDLRILEYQAVSAVDEPWPDARFVMTYLQTEDRPNEAWVLMCLADGDDTAHCRALVDSFEVDRLP